ncbi:hypothetical protein ACVJDU_001888 [Bradyrhizobium diazoefficiens]
MDEMRLHRKILAADHVLARPVEVHLEQLVFDVAERERAAFGEVELDRVPVVDDGVGALAPIQLQRRQLRLDRRLDVDRRLLQADRAGLVGRVEIAPFGRSSGAFIAPMHAFGGEGRLADRTKRKTREGLQCVTAIHHIPPR